MHQHFTNEDFPKQENNSLCVSFQAITTQTTPIKISWNA